MTSLFLLFLLCHSSLIKYLAFFALSFFVFFVLFYFDSRNYLFSFLPSYFVHDGLPLLFLNSSFLLFLSSP